MSKIALVYAFIRTERERGPHGVFDVDAHLVALHDDVLSELCKHLFRSHHCI